MPRFVVEELDGLWLVCDSNNNNKVCFRTSDKELAEKQARHLEPRTGLRPIVKVREPEFEIPKEDIPMKLEWK